MTDDVLDALARLVVAIEPGWDLAAVRDVFSQLSARFETRHVPVATPPTLAELCSTCCRTTGSCDCEAPGQNELRYRTKLPAHELRSRVEAVRAEIRPTNRGGV